MLLRKQKKGENNAKGGNNNNNKRFLITVNVIGSAGPLRFVVNEEQIVAAVIDMALKSYAREARLPVLGSNFNDFLLYCPTAGSDHALSPLETIGAHGARNFLLCKKPQPQAEAVNVETEAANITRRGSGSWKSWINKTLSLKIASH